MFELRRLIHDVPSHLQRDGGVELVRSDSERTALDVEPLLPFKEAKAVLVERFEREYLVQLLRRCAGNITRAGRESGLHRKSIERLVKKYQLDRRALKPARHSVSISGVARR
jgi:transcriptional regulator of acetoin/glycerol metabolism